MDDHRSQAAGGDRLRPGSPERKTHGARLFLAVLALASCTTASKDAAEAVQGESEPQFVRACTANAGGIDGLRSQPKRAEAYCGCLAKGAGNQPDPQGMRDLMMAIILTPGPQAERTAALRRDAAANAVVQQCLTQLNAGRSS